MYTDTIDPSYIFSVNRNVTVGYARNCIASHCGKDYRSFPCRKGFYFIMTTKILSKYTVFDLIFIAGCAALGIAIKPVLTPLVHMITGPLFIPGGSVAGGIYMLFIVVAALVINKPFSATLTTIVQAILVVVTGTIGSHGILSLFTYIFPGLVMDIVFYIFRYQSKHVLVAFLMGALANVAGTYASNLVFFRLPWIPLLLSLSAGFLFGGIGGIIAYRVSESLRGFIQQS